MIKRILASFALVVCSIFSGCSKTNGQSAFEKWAGESQKIRVLATTAMIDDLVRQIGGERIVHLNLIQGEIDPHSYELVKGDEEKISLATVVFYNGLGLEHGASLRYHLEHHPHAIAVGNEIRAAKPQEILMLDNQVDPHVWMDISLWMEAVGPIVKTLSSVDPSGKEEYEKNGAALLKEMESVHIQIGNDFSRIPANKRYLVTSHHAFHYFVRGYLQGKNDLENRCSAPEGLAPDGQLVPTDIQNVIGYLQAKEVHVLFSETNVSRDALRKIASICREKEYDVSIADKPLYSDAMGPPGSSADSYLKMMQYNAGVMLEAWHGSSP